MTRHFGLLDRVDEIIETMRVPVRTSEELVMLRKYVRDLALQLRLSLIDQTKLVTATSELARNTLKYGEGGEAIIYRVSNGSEPGVRVSLIDSGPGIDDLDQAMEDGFTSGGGLGLGLGGARRLVDDFELCSTPDTGTKVTITKWKK